jgi:hypothetical protein
MALTPRYSAGGGMASEHEESTAARGGWLAGSVVRLLADAYGVAPAEILMDVDRVAQWPGPNDDLLVWLATRHGWRGRDAVGYLGSLRRGLADRTGPT